MELLHTICSYTVAQNISHPFVFHWQWYCKIILYALINLNFGGFMTFESTFKALKSDNLAFTLQVLTGELFIVIKYSKILVIKGGVYVLRHYQSFSNKIFLVLKGGMYFFFSTKNTVFLLLIKIFLVLKGGMYFFSTKILSTFK